MHAVIVKCSLEMYTLVLISLAAAATGVSHSCYDYCTLLSTGQIKDITWRPDCTCVPKSHKNIDKIYKTNIQTYEGESAIYYEPAKLNYVPEFSFIYQPYVIVNPTLRDSSISETVGSKTKSLYSIDKQAKHTDIKIGTKQKRQEVIRTINIETKEQPLYLDIDIKKPLNYVRTSQKELSDIDHFELTEQELSDCVDLSMIIHFRKYNDISGLKSVWSDDKINKYNKLSSDDLIREYNIKCSKPANIFEQSFKDIKASLPRKKLSQMAYKENVDMPTNDILHDSISESTIRNGNQNLGLFETTINQKKYLNSESILMDKDIETSTNLVNKQDDINVIMEPLITTTESSINKLLSPHSTLKRNSEEYTDLNNIILSSSVASPLSSSVASPESNFNTDMELKTEASITYRKETNSYKSQENNEIITIAPLEQQQSFRSVHVPNSTVFQDVKYSSQITNADQVTQLNADQGNFNNTELIDSSEKVDDMTTSIIYSQKSRTVYPETKMQIPQIIVKEYPNDTVITEIDGNEPLPNNDFNDTNLNSTELNSNIEFTNETISFVSPKNTENTTDSAITLELEHTTEIYTESQEISGNLYFLFGEKSIPARFVQRPNGKISIGIDGSSLCQNKSTLLTHLCNCAKSHNCTNMLNEL